MRCPLCQTQLSDNARSCTRCDWVDDQPRSALRESQAHTRDVAALYLSLVPGLGHVYKGHLVFGGAILFVIGPLVLALSLSVVPGTLGLSLVIPLIFMLGVMFHAYHTPDKRAEVIERARMLNEARATH